MPEPLKNQFGSDIPVLIASKISRVFPAFKQNAFVKDVLVGYDSLDLMPRGRKIAGTLRRYLPANYPDAAEILIASLGPKLEKTEGNGMAPFLYLPHVFFVAEFGLDHFDVSMRAQYELTQRFTAEFSVRPFLERHTHATLERFKTWATDPSPHVRRLVSEGSRPRLPWAPRLRMFQDDPRPVLALLELLKDDPDLYVRRSVANNLNDIGKDHPELLVTTARSWIKKATKERQWLVSHALRSAVKRGDPSALAVMGFGDIPTVSVENVSIKPKRVVTGEAVKIAFVVLNTGNRKQRLLIDYCVHFIKANGKSSPKVFKLTVVELAPGASVKIEKNLSLAQLTTRKHYAGVHEVDVVLNGRTDRLGKFELVRA